MGRAGARAAALAVALLSVGCQGAGTEPGLAAGGAAGTAQPPASVALPRTPGALRDAVARLTSQVAAAAPTDTPAQDRRRAACAELTALSEHVQDPEVAAQVLVSSYSDLRLGAAARACERSPAEAVSSLKSVTRDLAGGNAPPG